jgi:cell division protein FtsQ
VLALLAAYPALKRRLAAIIRVSERRWDLKFANGVIVRLPEQGTARALATLNRLQGRERLLDRAVSVVDLRLPDRLVVRTAPETEGSNDKTRSGHKKAPARGAGKDA